jgi:F0F1-type ATP synthase alpha subunit
VNSGNQHFDKLVAAGRPVGEVIAVNSFLVTLTGLQPCAVRALILFEDGSKGFVHQVLHETVVVLHLGSDRLRIGMTAVVQHQELVTRVGKDLSGGLSQLLASPLMAKDQLRLTVSGLSLILPLLSTSANY